MALFEQALYAVIVAEVNKLDPAHPKKATYKRILPNFRIPYWDWAATDWPLNLLSTARISIPSGKSTRPILNPLNHFVFHPTQTGFPAPVSRVEL